MGRSRLCGVAASGVNRQKRISHDGTVIRSTVRAAFEPVEGIERISERSTRIWFCVGCEDVDRLGSARTRDADVALRPGAARRRRRRPGRSRSASPGARRMSAGSTSMTGNRACGAAPSEIRVWSGNHHTRAPGRGGRSPEVDRSGIPAGSTGSTAPSATRRSIQLRGSDGRTSRTCSSRAGANVEARNELDERPLHASATYGHPAVGETAAGARRRRQRARPGRKDAAARRGVRRRPAVGRRSAHRGREAAPCGRRRCERATTRQRLHAAAMRDVMGKPQHGDGGRCSSRTARTRVAPNSRHRRFTPRFAPTVPPLFAAGRADPSDRESRRSAPRYCSGLSSRKPSGGSHRLSDWSWPCDAIGSVATPPPFPTLPPPYTRRRC